MKLNRKGFTLVELLATIAIIALVLGISTYAVVRYVNSSKEQGKIISEASIKEGARNYSGEMGSDSWKKTDDYDVFCVTVGELVNKGILDKNATFTEDITKDTYVVVKRNKITFAIEKEDIAKVGDSNYNLCTGEFQNIEEVVNAPKVIDHTSYTDKIEISFEEGSATYKGVSSEVSYRCLYGTSSSNVNREGTINGNKCILDHLKNNSDYYAIIYMNTNHGSTVVAEGERNYKTTDFNVPMFSGDKNVVTINYNNKDTSGNDINNPSYYFKSTVNGVADIAVRKCSINNYNIECYDETDVIETGFWYKTEINTVSIVYPEANNTVSVEARIYDNSNNYANNTDTFTINKYTITFYKGDAYKINATSNYSVEKSCIAINDNTCIIKSPSLEAKEGYDIVGYNKDSTASSSTWDPLTEKEVNESGSYYAIVKLKTYTISYNANGGSDAPTSQTKEHGIDLTLSNDKPKRDGYEFLGWSTLSNSISAEYQPNGIYTGNSDVTLYAVWIVSSTSVNGVRYNCSDYSGIKRTAIYYVTTCSNGVCNYNLLNGLNSSYDFSLDVNSPITWNISESSLSDSLDSTCKSTWYVSASSGLNCRAGVSTDDSVTVKSSISNCTSVEVYRTTTKYDNSGNNWFYYANGDCYLSGAYLVSGDPCSSGGTSDDNIIEDGTANPCGTCYEDSDCKEGTCTGICSNGSHSYKCCKAYIAGVEIQCT